MEQLWEALRGKDELQASLAMHEILAKPNALDLIASHLDTAEPLLRQRLQQMSSIFNRGWLGFHFKDALENPEFTNWDIFCQLNVILDQQTSLVQINDVLNSIVANARFRFRTSEQLADYLRQAEFAVDHNLNRALVEYLVSDVLFSRLGSALVLAVIAERTAKIHGWNVRVGFVNGRPVIRDSTFNVLDPEDNWKITHPAVSAFLPATKHDLAVRLLTFIVNASVLEQIHSVTYNAVSLLVQLNGMQMNATSVEIPK